MFNYNYETKMYEDQMKAHKIHVVGVFQNGDGRFLLKTYYGFDKQHEVVFDILIDSNNPSYGHGTYQYPNREEDNLDIGIATFMRDQLNANRAF